MRATISILLASTLLANLAGALQVTPGSTCADLCLDNPQGNTKSPSASSTTPDDIVCTDNQFDTTTTGIKFSNCLDCLQRSNATSSDESDNFWFLYNVHYSLDVCMYGFPNISVSSISSPCSIASSCGPLKSALESSITNPSDTYGYCTADNNAFMGSSFEPCRNCLASSPNQAYLANFMVALKAGCAQKPVAGDLLDIDGTLFSTRQLNFTDPAQATPVNGDPNGSSSAFTTGAIVGIAVGAALLFGGGIALFWAYHRKQKRMYSNPITSHYDHRTGCGAITPPLQGGFMGGKPEMAGTSDYELRAQRLYCDDDVQSNFEVEKEIATRHPHWANNPNNPGSGPQGALPTHPAYHARTHSRQVSLGAVATVQANPTKSNKPDLFALQQYLDAGESVSGNHLPPPPPGPPPMAAIRSSSLRREANMPYESVNLSANHSRNSSIGSRGPSPDRRPLLNTTAPQRPSYEPAHQPAPAGFPFAIPPPPPRTSKVPSIGMPSLPKLRVPKKYAPPRIMVQDATPIDGPAPANQGDVPIGIEISDPLVEHPPRFDNEAFTKRRKGPPAPLAMPPRGAEQPRQPWTLQGPENRTA